jgi:hypothetical protein
MKTISDDEFTSYLVRAKQKMAAPGAIVDPLSQVIMADKGKGTKRGRMVMTHKSIGIPLWPRVEEVLAAEPLLM